jgi:hypothetical protein
MAVGFESGSPKIQDSTDSLEITKHEKTLLVTVNGPEFKKSLGTLAPPPDIYIIKSSNAHGIGAVHGGPTDAVVHSLVISADGQSGIWSESGVSWMSPFRPVNSTITFECSR